MPLRPASSNVIPLMRQRAHRTEIRGHDEAGLVGTRRRHDRAARAVADDRQILVDRYVLVPGPRRDHDRVTGGRCIHRGLDRCEAAAAHQRGSPDRWRPERVSISVSVSVPSVPEATCHALPVYVMFEERSSSLYTAMSPRPAPSVTAVDRVGAAIAAQRVVPGAARKRVRVDVARQRVGAGSTDRILDARHGIRADLRAGGRAA